MVAMRRWCAAAALGLGALLAGCRGGDCVKLCEQNNACPGAPKSDCEKQCADADQLSRSAGCEDRFDELARCSAKRSDPCAPSACRTEQKMYEDCVTRYCTKNPSATGCR